MRCITAASVLQIALLVALLPTPTHTAATAPSRTLQAGTALSLSDADRRGLVLGLALHDKGRASMEGGDLQVERACAHCRPGSTANA
jgi:hypothetical protein